MSSLKEECGVIGIFGDKEASNLSYLGLYALQHRGQEACGIVTFCDDKKTHLHKAFGLVGESFNKDILHKLTGKVAIGHVRYSTTGGRSLQNIQPFVFNGSLGPVAIAHNGNLTNSKIIRKDLEAEGSIFQSTSDTEVFMHLLAKSRGRDILERIIDVISQVKGAYSLLLATPDRLYAIKDPYGFRPLVIGRKGGAYIFASETCALDLIDATFEREVMPGEIVEISEEGLKSHFPNGQNPAKKGFCIFELIYFSRPDSRFGEGNIYDVRKKMGHMLALEDSALQADVVIAVPDSGVPMAMGYAKQKDIPFEVGLVRNHYVGRTFIEPAQSIRDFGVKLKLNPVGSVLRGKRVVVVDDSLVRGTTSAKIVRIIRNAGASEVHMRIGSPPITHSCYFGVDTPKRSKLLAAQRSMEEMRAFIGADSLRFLSINGLEKAVNDPGKSEFCYGCFNGKYAEPVSEELIRQLNEVAEPEFDGAE